MCKIELSFWYFKCCECTKKLKNPFLKVESICLYVPIVDNFQYKKYSYLICLLYWCYAMFKFCSFVNNVQNGHHRTSNICNNITCIEVIAALENSSIIYIPTCKVLIMTEFNTILHRFLLQSPLKCPWNCVVYVTAFFRYANSCSTSQTPKYYKP